MQRLYHDDIVIEYRLTPSEARREALRGGGKRAQDVANQASMRPHGWVLKALIRGAPYYSPRPYVLGYGCDGLTTTPILRLAQYACELQGIDFWALYQDAYPDEEWEQDIKPYPQGVYRPACMDYDLLIDDVHDINYTTLAGLLTDALEERGIPIYRWGSAERHKRHKAQLEGVTQWLSLSFLV